jgi:stress-induced-phosphoprotein 1
MAANPSTKHLLEDPSFVAKLQAIQKNPQAGIQEIGSDHRFVSVLGVLLGMECMAGFPGRAGGGEPMQTDEPVPPPFFPELNVY